MRFPVSFGLSAAYVLLGATEAFAHVGIGHVDTFAAGLAHPLGGLDHVAVMIAVGLWAGLKGGRAVWIWPAAFVALMLAGGALGMAQISLPFVEPAILASVVALGLLVALAVDVPLWLGAVVIGAFAIFHGYAHGAEAPEAAGGFAYMAGFALATALLHALGIGFALAVTKLDRRPLIRVAGAACILAGVGLAAGVF